MINRHTITSDLFSFQYEFPQFKCGFDFGFVQGSIDKDTGEIQIDQIDSQHLNWNLQVWKKELAGVYRIWSNELFDRKIVPRGTHPWNCVSLPIPDSVEKIRDGMNLKIAFEIDMKKGSCDIFYQGTRLGMGFKDLPLNGEDGVGIVPAIGFDLDSGNLKGTVRQID